MRPIVETGAAMLAAACLLGVAGCAASVVRPGPEPLPAAPGGAVEPPGEKMERSGFGLSEALEVSLTELLELETVDSLRRIAAEHIHNDILLRLPGIQAEYRSSAPPPVKNSLALLDGAIAYNHILSAPPGAELPDERRPRVRQLLELSGAENWAGLAAVREKIELSGGVGTPELRQQEAELLLELRIATGFDNEMLLTFDFATLPMPRKLDTPLVELQRRAVMMRSESAPLEIPETFPEQVRKLYGDDPAAVPLLVEALYRLPRKLAQLQLDSPNRDLRDLAALGSAAGIVCEVELCHDRLQEAWEIYDAECRRADNSPESRIALAEALLQWRLAHFRLLAATGGNANADAARAGTSPRPATPEVAAELLKLLSKN